MALLHYIENNSLHAILRYNPISFEIAERLIQKPCGPTPLPFYVKQMIVVAIILANQLAHFVLAQCNTSNRMRCLLKYLSVQHLYTSYRLGDN